MRQPKPTIGEMEKLHGIITERDKRIADLETTVTILLERIRNQADRILAAPQKE